MNVLERNIKKQNGSIAVYVTIVLLSMLIILSALFITSSSSLKSQLTTALKVKESYQADNARAADVYNELISRNQ